MGDSGPWTIEATYNGLARDRRVVEMTAAPIVLTFGAIMQSVDAVRDQLLELHRLLLEEARQEHERVHGTLTPGQFLGLLMNDDEFAWLRSLTALIVELDEQKSTVVDSVWADRARELLRPDASGNAFQKRFDELVHRSQEVSAAHGSTMRAMS